jgi:hypothetical protein
LTGNKKEKKEGCCQQGIYVHRRQKANDVRRCRPLAVSKKRKTLSTSNRNWLIIGIFSLIGFLNCELFACSCDPISFDDALEYADEIFVGTIKKAELYENGTYINGSGQEEINWDWRYYFEIRKKWKGSSESHLVVHHQGNSCDFFFDIYEEEYLVYASRKSGKESPYGVTVEASNGKNKLSTWPCSRTIDNHHWKEDNWFKNDVIKLSERFPTEIALSKFQINWIWITLLGLLAIIAFSMRKKLNRK